LIRIRAVTGEIFKAWMIKAGAKGIVVEQISFVGTYATTLQR
jgi:hypothetical protein